MKATKAPVCETRETLRGKSLFPRRSKRERVSNRAAVSAVSSRDSGVTGHLSNSNATFHGNEANDPFRETTWCEFRRRASTRRSAWPLSRSARAAQGACCRVLPKSFNKTRDCASPNGFPHTQHSREILPSRASKHQSTTHTLCRI